MWRQNVVKDWLLFCCESGSFSGCAVFFGLDMEKYANIPPECTYFRSKRQIKRPKTLFLRF
jgi:hypothetical protein